MHKVDNFLHGQIRQLLGDLYLTNANFRTYLSNTLVAFNSRYAKRPKIHERSSRRGARHNLHVIYRQEPFYDILQVFLEQIRSA